MKQRDIFMRSVPAICGLIILVFFGSILSQSKYHRELTQYGNPICSVDRHRFESETCDSCGRDVIKSGVFFSVDVALTTAYSDDYQLAFKDYYDSWEAFQADYDMCMQYSLIVFGTVIVEICLYAFMWFKARQEAKYDKRLKGAGRL